jgi:hypothetical protein
MAWETWYRFERNVPNVNPAADLSVLADAYDQPAYSERTTKHQFMAAGDLLWFY